MSKDKIRGAMITAGLAAIVAGVTSIVHLASENGIDGMYSAIIVAVGTSVLKLLHNYTTSETK